MNMISWAPVTTKWCMVYRLVYLSCLCSLYIRHHEACASPIFHKIGGIESCLLLLCSSHILVHRKIIHTFGACAQEIFISTVVVERAAMLSLEL